MRVLTLIAALLALPQLSGCGVAEYGVELDEGIILTRYNAQQVYITAEYEGEPFSLHPTEIGRAVGPLVGVFWTDELVVAKHGGMKWCGDQGHDGFLVTDLSQAWWFIIPRTSKKAIGPLDEAEFTRRQKDFGLPANLPLRSEAEAYRFALNRPANAAERARRAELGQAIRGLKLIVFGVVILGATGSATVVWWLGRRKKRRLSVGR